MGAAAGRVIPFFSRPRESRVQTDFQHLLDRLEQRQYASTLPVLGFYWLRTVYHNAYSRAEIGALQGVIRRARKSSPQWTSILDQLQEWISHTALPSRHSSHREEEKPVLSTLQGEVLVPYLARMMNEWLPVELAHLLVEENDPDDLGGVGIPAFATARALERLLGRERLSTGTLQSLLDPAIICPRYIYPADAEILRDVVLFLLGRTEAPIAPALPALLLSLPPGSTLPKDFEAAVEGALLVNDEVQVPIPATEAFGILNGDRVRIGSTLVTMDGRWWQANRLLEDGNQHVIVYRPGGRVEIDTTGDHVRLRIPWPQPQWGWSGEVHFPERFDLFGREWNVERWEQDAEHTWLHLVFVRALAVSEIAPVAAPALRRSRPAFVDMAWTALEQALLAAIRESKMDSLERLRRTELIPIGRALFALVEALFGGGRGRRELVETRLKSIDYLQAEVAITFGRVPWRVLPEPVRRRLLADRRWAPLLETTFDGLPGASGAVARGISSERAPSSPSTAA